MKDPRMELKVAGVEKNSPKQGGGTLVKLEQFYKGVKVSRGHYKVVFTSEGKLSGITGVFSPNIDISPVPAIDSLSAIGIATRDLNYTNEDEKSAQEFLARFPKKRKPINASLFVVSYENQYRLVWIIGLYRERPESPQNWEYWVDAQTGTILQKKDVMIRGGHKIQVPNTPPSDSVPETVVLHLESAQV